MLVNFTCHVASLPERKVAKNGNSFYVFRVGHNEFRNGERNTIWVSCCLFGNNYDRIIQFLKIGTAVDLSGDLYCTAYSDKNTNEPRVGYNLNVNFIGFAMNGYTNKSNSDGSDYRGNQAETQPSIDIPSSYKKSQQVEVASISSKSSEMADYDDDLPF